MHGVGTVVFTVSAQFGVPVVPYIWSLTRGITSYAREIFASLAEVERLSSRSSRQWPSRSGREQETKGPLWVRSRPARSRCERPLSANSGLSVENGMAVNFSATRCRRSHQHRAASRSQFFALIQAMIFQIASSVVMISPKGGIGPQHSRSLCARSLASERRPLG